MSTPLHSTNDQMERKQFNQPKAIALVIAFGLFAVLAIAGCAAPATLPPTPDSAQTQTFESALALARQTFPTDTVTPTITPTATPVPPTATPVHTPSPLPPVFRSNLLAKDVVPQTYITDTCQYLKERWDPNNSAPGTVVMVIMYHSVTEDYNPLFPDGSQVHDKDVGITFKHAHEVGFQTINAQQLADFLDHNAKIPPRSLLVIVDDRKTKTYYETHFIPRLQEYGWTITNAWISAKDTLDSLYKENEEVVQQGYVDVQAHGVVHNVNISEGSTDEFINGELKGSIDAIKQHFGKAPVGFIWPGGGFTRHAIELARQAGYRVGFTTNPRGPIMYNWIPQSEKADQDHPFWLPEIPASDPRMTLPRYWSIDAAYRIDDVIAIGDAAIEEAAKNKAGELDYYNVMCAPKLGPIPTEPAPTPTPTSAT